MLLDEASLLNREILSRVILGTSVIAKKVKELSGNYMLAIVDSCQLSNVSCSEKFHNCLLYDLFQK